jgi:hypothetical protein
LVVSDAAEHMVDNLGSSRTAAPTVNLEAQFVQRSPIATRELIGQKDGGERFKVTIRIGPPYQVNDVSWACPVAVYGVDRQLADMHGIDSWQALLLAISLVRSRVEHFLETGGKLYWPEDPTHEVTLRDIFGLVT